MRNRKSRHSIDGLSICFIGMSAIISNDVRFMLHVLSLFCQSRQIASAIQVVFTVQVSYGGSNILIIESEQSAINKYIKYAGEDDNTDFDLIGLQPGQGTYL